MENFAIVIGINDYTPLAKDGLRTLGGAINDADAVENWLLDLDGGNVPRANCHKILSSNHPLTPYQTKVDDKFIEILDKVEKNGGSAKRFYFYFAGHGQGSLFNNQKTGLCLANWSEKRRRSALSFEGYYEEINNYGYFEEIIFLADCCRNPIINNEPKIPSFAPQMANRVPSGFKKFIAYATQYQDESYEIANASSELRGAFTTVLLRGLKGEASNEGGVVDGPTLKQYLIDYTPLEAQKAGYKQNPQINQDFQGPIAQIGVEEVESVKCVITFTDKRTSSIDFIDGTGTVMESFDPTTTPQVEVILEKGLYMLQDSHTEPNKESIHILPSKETKHVSF